MKEYKAIDVARYIAELSHQPKYGLINYLTLPSILLIIQGIYSLINRKCFTDTIYLTPCGVKIDSVYQSFGKYGLNSIYPEKNVIIDDENCIFGFRSEPYVCNLEKDDKEIIQQLFHLLSHRSSTCLFQLIQSYNFWQQADFSKISTIILPWEDLHQSFQQKYQSILS